MDQRGVTLVEIVVAALAGSIVLFTLGLFYLDTQEAIEQGGYQAALQRQGTLAQQEMGRIILASSGLLAGICGPAGAGDSLPVQIPPNALADSPLSTNGGFVCLYLDSDEIRECRFTSVSDRACIDGSVRSLLNGAPIQRPIRAAISPGFTCTGTPPNPCVFSRVAGTAVDINFALCIQIDPSILPTCDARQMIAGPLTFQTRLTVRN
jgi:hypothetical protein